MPVPEPAEASDRGFLNYAGGPIATSYGHTITVRESSAAMGPHVWMFISKSERVDGFDPHLSLAEALRLRAALDQFIDGVPERWDGGDELLAEARREALGES